MRSFLLQRPLGTLALLLAFTMPAGGAFAGTLGGIAGTVTDATTGAPIPGVHLQISAPSATVTATTDAKGHFIVLSLQPDNYTLTAVKEGYDTQSVSDDAVYADQTQQYNLELTPSAKPPGSP